MPSVPLPDITIHKTPHTLRVSAPNIVAPFPTIHYIALVSGSADATLREWTGDIEEAEWNITNTEQIVNDGNGNFTTANGGEFNVNITPASGALPAVNSFAGKSWKIGVSGNAQTPTKDGEFTGNNVRRKAGSNDVLQVITSDDSSNEMNTVSGWDADITIGGGKITLYRQLTAGQMNLTDIKKNIFNGGKGIADDDIISDVLSPTCNAFFSGLSPATSYKIIVITVRLPSVWNTDVNANAAQNYSALASDTATLRQLNTGASSENIRALGNLTFVNEDGENQSFELSSLLQYRSGGQERVRQDEIQLGDGYKQTVVRGLNPVEFVYELEFLGRHGQIDSVVEFMTQNTRFYFLPPLAKAKKFLTDTGDTDITANAVAVNDAKLLVIPGETEAGNRALFDESGLDASYKLVRVTGQVRRSWVDYSTSRVYATLEVLQGL